jgi:hypothetical protein
MVRRLSALLLLVLLFAAFAGCAKKKVMDVGNLPPETSLFVQGTVDTVSDQVHLYWFGSDPDGQVVGFELRFQNPADPADSQWVFTSRSDSVFNVYAPAGFSAPRFEVRAIDGEGMRDPTPAIQDFSFTNAPPTVHFTQRLLSTDTTYASATLSWAGSDPDGDVGAMRFQVGLDTLPAALHLVAAKTFTFDTTDFKIGGAYASTRPRQAYVRAVDAGGRLSAWDSVRWVVRQPSAPGVHPRLLIIDDVPASNPANARADSTWLNNVERNLPPGSYSLLKLGVTQPFRSAKDVLQTFKEFDAVIWYRDVEVGFSTLLSNYQDALALYLDGGGKLVLEGGNLITGTGSIGPLRQDWVTRYLGSTALINSPISGRVDSTVAWSTQPGFVDSLDANNPAVLRNIILRSPAYRDSMWYRSIDQGLRGFEVRDTNFVALWAADSALVPRVPRSIPIAVSVPVPESPPGPGRMVLFSVPIRKANSFFNAPRIIGKLLQQLGLTGP